MKLPRVRLKWPRRRPSEAAPPPVVAESRPSPDEDTRLLRRTRLKLMAWSGALTLVVLVALGVATYGVVDRSLDESDKTALQHYMDRHRINAPTSVGPEAAELGGEGANLFEIFITPDGRALPPRGQAAPPKGLPNQASLDAAKASSQGIDQRSITGPDGTPYTIVSVQALGPGNTVWLIQFVQNRSAEQRLLATLFLILLGGGAAALVIAIFFGYLYSGRALVPIRDSIARRQAALQRQREFTANASHELRAPLTVMRASVEDLRRNRRKRVEEVGDALGDIEDEVRIVTALVDDMLLLARTDSGAVQLDRVPLDLSDEAAEATSLLSTLGLERGVAVMLDPRPAPITGDPVRLRQLVTILLDNAVRHSPPGSTVEVRVQPDERGALLEVLDTGPGIKPEDMPRLWDRFWRADDAPAGGTGLGLAIAKWIVEQHGGTIGAENRPEGGARFWARLPATLPGARSVAEPLGEAGPWSAAEHGAAGDASPDSGAVGPAVEQPSPPIS